MTKKTKEEVEAFTKNLRELSVGEKGNLDFDGSDLSYEFLKVPAGLIVTAYNTMKGLASSVFIPE